MVRLIILTAIAVLLASSALAFDGDWETVVDDGRIRIRMMKKPSGGIMYTHICARATSGTVGDVQGDLRFVDSFGKVLVSRHVRLYWIEGAQALCHSQAVPAQAKDYWKVEFHLIHYDAH